jgi:DNA-binding NarL/FixJ family response regulator
MPIQVLLVDDASLFCEILKDRLEVEQGIEVVGIAIDGQDAVAQVEQLHPDIVLMDIQMPVMGGCQATRLIAQNYPRVKVVMLSTFNRKAYVEEATQAGAWGYLVKSMKYEDLFYAIHRINQGHRVFCRESFSRIHLEESLGTSNPPFEVSGLTQREQEVLNLVVSGLQNIQIGDRLNLSEATVKYHVSKLLKHFHLRSRTQLISHLYRLQSQS